MKLFSFHWTAQMPSSSASSFRVASVPLVSRRGEAAQNVARIADWLALAARRDTDLVVFPEACIAGYASMMKLGRAELNALAETLDGASIRAVADAVERTGVSAGVGMIERAADGQLFNSYVVCLPGGVRHCHRKLHAFEHPRIGSGDRFTVFDTPTGVRIGVLIGADNYLVENMRMTALMGADVLIAPHRTYGMDSDGSEWAQPVSIEEALRRPTGENAPRSQADPDAGKWLRRWLAARAVDNGMFIVVSDGAEIAGQPRTTGTAMIVDPFGRTLEETSSCMATGCLISADLDARLTRTSPGRQWLNARRPDLYGMLSRSALSPRDFEARSVSGKGAVALAFAQVRRNRAIG
ncbi:nitrilase-related carbon-nitrogen hydrolase [Paraburkholderia dilworthii]|uniref:nitrilase-related carbon-nitrogen hydrolase n=1 Tax=Paraburkholderia dilworthii TaxID=948106 RepID=UPI000410C847|nr:nitrilase-related carbon-nitrogen hydrolase [Paraburkholderia dilworthii]